MLKPVTITREIKHIFTCYHIGDAATCILYKTVHTFLSTTVQSIARGVFQRIDKIVITCLQTIATIVWFG